MSFSVDRSCEKLFDCAASSCSNSTGCADDDDYNLDTRISCDELNIELDMVEMDKFGYHFSVVDPVNRRSYVFALDPLATP